MLNRSRSWPVQSVITLDPRGIICAKVQPSDGKKPAQDHAKPDIVLEANDRHQFLTRPDIFLTLEPKTEEKDAGADPLQIKFVDHYQVLDSASGKSDQGFVVTLSSEKLEVPGRIDESALVSDRNECCRSDKSFKVSADVEKSNTGSASCEICHRSDGEKSYLENPELPNVHEENQFLSSYQIDILRKSLKKRRESSFDCSLDKESSEKTRKPFDRKLTSDFESVASNETKTTDCEACNSKRNFRREGRSSFHLIRSYSLGHEKTRQKLTGTFKKFSLPTPIIQQKEGNENAEAPQEGVAPRNINLDKRKVTTLTRHYYPEGGWGYVIVTCSVMVHILCHGFQLAAGTLMIPAAVKFRTDAVHTGGTQKMNSEINQSNTEVNDESAENENGLDETIKSNGFLYVDINDYNENDLDGIEIKEEEEQVEDITLQKGDIETEEFYFEENLPLNSLKNLTNHSQNEDPEEVCIKNKKIKNKRSIKSIERENILVNSQTIGDYKENSNFNGYRLRARTRITNVDLIEKVDKKKGIKLSSHKKTVCTKCGASFPNKNKFLKHEAEKTKYECLNCKELLCTSTLLDVHIKLCETKNNNKDVKFNCKKYSAEDGLIFYENNLENYKTNFYKCDRCSRSFNKKKNLVSHILKNDCTCEIYSCASCDETFIKKSSLEEHTVAHLKDQQQCQFCFEIIPNDKSQNKHCCSNNINSKDVSQNSEPETQLNDGVNCSELFQESADNQTSKVSCSTLFKCSFCGKIYKGTVSYEKHLKSHRDLNHESNNFSSKQTEADGSSCQKSKTVKKKIRYECDTCGRGFLKLVKLKIHILNVHQGINYQCEKCNIKFPNQEDLDAHVRNQSCKSDVCTCKTCGKVFAKRDYLKKHQYMHMNVLFKCKYCYCAFMKEKSYKRHMEKMNCSKSARKIRMAEFNYKKCRLCDVEYDSEEVLINHFKTSHTGLEPHQCFCCDSCLPTFQDLQNHIHQHNIQKYTCNLCGKPYTSQEGFRKHRLKHKGAEFKCKYCDSEFLNESRYKFHEKTCKKNPDTGYEPTQDKEKRKKKDEKPKQSRQLHWESRIIMKRLRGDPKSLTGDQKIEGDGKNDGNAASTFFDDPDTDTDERGWFNNYYKTEEDDIAFGLRKADELTSQDCDSDCDVSEFLQTGSVSKKRKVPNTDSAAGDHEVDTGLDNTSSSSSEDSSCDSDEEIKDANLPIDYNPKKCRLCVANFSQEYELLHHFIKTHPGEYAHKCPQCEVESPLYAQLKEHLKSHGIGIGIFNCDNCSKQFKSEKKMNSHKIRCKGINNKTADKKLSEPGNSGCKRCGKKFHTKFGYRRHKQLCKKRKNKSKTSGNSARVNGKEEAVPESSQVSVAEEEEEVSKRNNDKPVPVAGSAEIRSEGEEKKKNEVKVNYTGEPPMDSFPCRLCDKKFQYERGIVMHFKSAHPGNKPLICHVCNMHLADKLKEHLKTHGIGEEFVCELCGKRFNQKFLSKIHEMWHQGIEYKCNNCKQKFLNKEKMDKHIGENRCSNRQSLMRLPCDICGKSYRSKFGLSKHYITHTPKELRPVKNRMNCEYCGKWFEYNNGLQRHRRIHTGERPFCCRFCPKAFAQEGNCKAHERIHTGEPKPRKKKPPTVATSSATLTSQVTPAVSTINTISYPEHINIYIYNSTNPINLPTYLSIT